MEPHGVPALLSFFFPGLGQLVKGQWPRFAGIWSVLVIIWLIYLVVVTRIIGPEVPEWIPAFALALHAIPTVIVWLWGVVDAYRSPSA